MKQHKFTAIERLEKSFSPSGNRESYTLLLVFTLIKDNCHDYNRVYVLQSMVIKIGYKQLSTG